MMIVPSTKKVEDIYTSLRRTAADDDDAAADSSARFDTTIALFGID